MYRFIFATMMILPMFAGCGTGTIKLPSSSSRSSSSSKQPERVVERTVERTTTERRPVVSTEQAAWQPDSGARLSDPHWVRQFVRDDAEQAEAAVAAFFGLAPSPCPVTVIGSWDLAPLPPSERTTLKQGRAVARYRDGQVFLSLVDLRRQIGEPTCRDSAAYLFSELLHEYVHRAVDRATGMTFTARAEKLAKTKAGADQTELFTTLNEVIAYSVENELAPLYYGDRAVRRDPRGFRIEHVRAAEDLYRKGLHNYLGALSDPARMSLVLTWR